MDFSKTPGKEIKVVGKLENAKEKKTISIVTPFYNGGATLDETANSVLSQTYPFFEWVIVDDGSQDKDSLKKLAALEKKDDRIVVYHKENGGPAETRDYGIEHTSKETKYVLFLDCDDMMAPTMLECMYWTLETHPEASFTYTSMVNFGAREFYWEPYLDLNQQKVDNLINIASMVKKEDLIEVGMFGLREKGIYEDWNLWLKLLCKGKIPIRMNAPVFWYRTNDTGEFSRAKQNHARAMEIINETAKDLDTNMETIQFPRYCKDYITKNKLKNMILPQYNMGKKKNVLFLIPWAVVGGADVFNLELIKRLDKNKFNVIVVSTLPMKNVLRQSIEEYTSEYYDLSNFLDYKDYNLFVEYLTKSRHIDVAFVSNTVLGYALLPSVKKANPNALIIDYVHSIDLKDYRGGFGKYSRELESILDYTLTCNDFTKEQLINDYDRENVETVYIGTDEKKYDIGNFNIKELKREFNLPMDKKIIGFIARLSYEKRPEFFIDIAASYLKKRDDAIFVIAGDGPLFDNVQDKINKYGLKDKIILLGMMKESEKFYSVCDVTINCSLLEGLALTSYESLSMGVPVISADVGGQKELINETNGYIVPKGLDKHKEKDEYVKALVNILDNTKKYKAAARKTIVEGFTLDLMAQNIEKIFGKKTHNEVPATFSKEIFSYHLVNMKSYINGLVNNYRTDVLHIMEEDHEDFSRFAPIKKKFKKISYKYYLTKEMFFVFKTIKCFAYIFKYLIKSIIELIKFVFMIIPCCYQVVHIIVRIVRTNLKSK